MIFFSFPPSLFPLHLCITWKSLCKQGAPEAWQAAVASNRALNRAILCYLIGTHLDNLRALEHPASSGVSEREAEMAPIGNGSRGNGRHDRPGIWRPVFMGRSHLYPPDGPSVEGAGRRRGGASRRDHVSRPRGHLAKPLPLGYRKGCWRKMARHKTQRSIGSCDRGQATPAGFRDRASLDNP